jgi:hypothetical protein
LVGDWNPYGSSSLFMWLNKRKILCNLINNSLTWVTEKVVCSNQIPRPKEDHGVPWLKENLYIWGTTLCNITAVHWNFCSRSSLPPVPYKVTMEKGVKNIHSSRLLSKYSELTLILGSPGYYAIQLVRIEIYWAQVTVFCFKSTSQIGPWSHSQP